MPLITVAYSTIRKNPSLKAEIASAVSELTARILRKDPKVTAVIVKSVDAADWFAVGRSLHEESYAHVDEVKGDAYGFGGLTQERRYIAGKLEIAPQKAAA
jgi:4-oxalocrotonate tautomerase